MKRKYILPFLLFVQIVLLQILFFFPEFVERFYSNGLYPLISKFSRIVLGSIPFSIGDGLYFITLFILARWFLKKRKSWKNTILQILSFLSVFYFLFHILWALNYYRQPLFEKMKIETEYSDTDLLAFTKKIILKTNTIHKQITKNDTLKVVFPYTQEQVFKMNITGYEQLAIEHPYFTYSYSSIKKSIISLPLTYMGFAGYLNPFTNEAQVNDLTPMYNFPITTCHEMAHQIGYASESECNFIGYLASIKNKDLYFQYSGYSFALRYCLTNWSVRNPKTLEQLLKTIHPGILKNYRESENFWKEYESPIETGFKIFYDNFLKTNQQKDGLNSYNKFVNLMVNYYKEKEL